MPLVRIALRKGHPAGFGRKVGQVVYEAMVDTIGVPQNDLFQIVSEHDEEHLIFDPGYLGIPRSAGFIVIQATISEGRPLERKQALYRAIAERLKARLGVRPQDIFINLVEVKKENWSFGNGIAQYVTPVAAA
jgi:phenylpyruvate tautomerase PptA (4-oxalocrotonate tautomerase family)